MGISRGTSGGLRRHSVLAWLRLLRVELKVSEVLAEQLKGWGLNNAQFDVLAHVGANEGVMQQELADSLLVTKGNIAQLLDRMQKRGLIERRPEGRTNRLFLTEMGQLDGPGPRRATAVRGQVGGAVNDLFDQMANTITPDQAQAATLEQLEVQLDHTVEGNPSVVGERRNPKAVDRKL